MSGHDPYAKLPPPLPDNFRRHTAWFFAALLVGFAITLFPSSRGSVTFALSILLSIPIWCIAVVYICYYFIAYPVIHAALRYRGPSRSLWLGWLAVESIGVACPFIRIAYLFTHIIPDIRGVGPYHRRPTVAPASPIDRSTTSRATA